jgi:hypothetical protein
MTAGGEDDIHAAVSDAGGPDTRSLTFLVTDDAARSVCEDVERVRAWPYLPHLQVGGFLYDVATGRVARLC